jgi:hypothetical protein
LSNSFFHTTHFRNFKDKYENIIVYKNKIAIFFGTRRRTIKLGYDHNMMKPKWSRITARFVVILVLLNSYELLYSQISAYSSASYGYSSNPLYNYQKLSDQLFQTYVEVTSNQTLESSVLNLQYVGGSMIFNRFILRNYYEHSFGVQFETKFFPSSKSIIDEQNDSAGISFHTDLQVSARHDKKEFREFDNCGLTSNNLLSINVGNGFVGGINNKAEYRIYQYIHPYDNFSEIFSFDLEHGVETEFQYGFSISGGLKYFLKIKYDTTLFEETRSYIIQNVPDSILVGAGQQRHWVYSTYPDTSESDKTLLQRPKTKTAYQIAVGGFIQQNGSNALFRTEVVYRINSRSTLQTLVQNSSTLSLNEDLYNSVFNAHGPEIHFLIKYLLPLNIQVLTTIDVEHKIYETPAYDLISGETKNYNREDINTSFELYISKFFQVTEMFGFEISFSSNYLQNKSNDAYNDYSLIGYSLSIGCGF